MPCHFFCALIGGCHLGHDGFLDHLTQHGNSCDILVFPDLVFPLPNIGTKSLTTVIFVASRLSNVAANLLHLRL